MKPKQLITALVLGLLTLTCFAQKKIAERLMQGDTGLVLFKRAETQKYIVATAIDRNARMFYLLDRKGNTWDSLRMQPYDCDQVLRHHAGPFDYYLAAQRQIRAYRNELIRQLRRKGRLDPTSPYYEAALYEHPELQHTDSTSAIKGILTMEQENRRDSTYSWGATCDEPGSFINGSTFTNNDAGKPGDSYARGDTLFYINPEITSRLHRAVLVQKAGSLDYFNRDGLKIWSFKLNPKSIAQLSKEDVFTYYLEYLEKSKQVIDRQVKAASNSLQAQYASLKQPGNFNLAEDQRLIDQQLDYTTAPDLKGLATRLKEASRHAPVNAQWLSFLGMGSYTPPASWDSIGTRRYELDNHLGNVMATITDKRIATGGYYLPDVSTAQDYYAFGALMPSRTYKADSNYRYGFNGKENDNAVKGVGNQQDYGMRIYDPRVGRFLSVDPLTSKYPELTPYQFADNMPIKYIDLDGLEAAKPEQGKTDLLIVIQGYPGYSPAKGRTQTRNAERENHQMASDEALGSLGPKLSNEFSNLQTVTYASSTTNFTIEDVQKTISMFRKENPNGQIIVVGHSLGGENLLKALSDPKGPSVDLLITIDPHTNGPQFMTKSDLNGNVKYSINYYENGLFSSGGVELTYKNKQTNGVNILVKGTIHTDIDDQLVKAGILEKEISALLKNTDPIKTAKSLEPVDFSTNKKKQ